MQRGNRDADVFIEPEDRARYLELLADCAGRHQIEVTGWCLMSNHIHLVVVPPDAEALGLALRSLHMRYAQWLNRRQGWSGHVWQGRFYSCALDEAFGRSALRHVERNPLRAGLVGAAEDYPWSSAALHCGVQDAASPGACQLEGVTPEAWRELLATPLPEDEAKLLRARTRSGLPCGDAAFVARVSALVGRELVARGPGRPRRPEG